MLHNSQLDDVGDQPVHQKQLIETLKADLEKLALIKDKLLSVVSHDLKSPLANVDSVLTFFAEGGFSAEELINMVPMMGREIHRALFLIDNLTIWSKIQLEGVCAKPENFHVLQLIEDEYLYAVHWAKEKGIRFEKEESGDYMACADYHMMKLVLRNLISNAIKFSSRGDTVCIDVVAREKMAEVVVKDTGTGIEDIREEEIFGVGHHSSYGTNKEKGYGIGLTICKYFAELNGGHISVESEVGKGSRFSFTLPAEKLA